MKRPIYNLLEKIGQFCLTEFRMKILPRFLPVSNGSCSTSERFQIVPNVKSNRVSVRWNTGEGKLI